jgi:hypothetical protein
MSSTWVGDPIDKLVVLVSPLPAHKFRRGVTVEYIVNRIKDQLGHRECEQVSLVHEEGVRQLVDEHVDIMIVVITSADDDTIGGKLATKLIHCVQNFKVMQLTAQMSSLETAYGAIA